LLLGDRGEISGLQEAPEFSFVLRDPKTACVFVIGTPPTQAVQAALAHSREVIAPLEHSDWLAEILPEWSRTRIIVHSLPGLQSLPINSTGEVRFLEPHTLPHLSIPEELRQELRIGAESSLIAAVFVKDRPVSFCYAGSRTEALWDVSIDTLAEYQRKGYAGMCATYMIRYMRTQGKQPVWQAVEENPASWRLAQKLGFVPVDELDLFERRD
jgi:GNAT superfamily N-acetyltransferase